MVCTKNNNTHFENYQDYTSFCETCNLHVKLYKFRSCEIRHQKLAEQGIDVFKEAKELEKIVGIQVGQQTQMPANLISKQSTTQPKKNPSRRGR